MIDYKTIDWGGVKERGSKVLLVDIDRALGVKTLDNIDESKREQLLHVNKYITHESNSYGPQGKVFVYDILERAIDDKDNLILFVKSEMIQFNR